MAEDFLVNSGEVQDQNEIKELKDFREGIIPFLEKFLENSKMLFNVLNANILTNEEKKILSYELKDIEFKIKEIQNKVRTLILELTHDTIHNECQREYYAFFTDQPDESKLNFVFLVLHFSKIKEFYDLCLENLNLIKKIIIQKISPQSYFYQQFVEFQLRTIFFKMHKLEILLKRLGIILNYQKNKETQKIYNLVRYSPNINYKYSLIFKENLKDYIISFFEQETKEDKKLEVKTNIQKKILTTQIDQHSKSKSYIQNNMLNTSGNYLWNSSLYYFLTYDSELLKKEEQIFQNVFYIDSHLGATSDVVKSQIIRSLLKKNSIFTPEEAKTKYKQFLNSLFEMNQQVLCFNFKISTNFSFLFMYHLGPLTFFTLNKQYLQDLKTGYIHQIYKKNVIRKSIPFEFIKRYLFDWWIQNIMNNISEEDKNSFSKYTQLNTHIQKIIFEISKKFKSEFPNEEILWENPKFQQFLKDKIGNINIFLVQRYRNLFKHFELR